MRRIKRRRFTGIASPLGNIIDLGGIPPEDYALATTAMGTLRELAAYCSANDPARIAKAFQPHEVAALRRWVVTVRGWNLVFDRTLAAGEPEVQA
jgi:hypothetical protein